MIVDAILDHRLKNVVFLAGDVHLAQANAYDPDQDGVIDFHEYVAGPLSARHGRLTATDNGLHQTQLFYESGFDNFGLVRVTKDEFAITVVDETGTKRFSMLCRLGRRPASTLRPLAIAADGRIPYGSQGYS